MTTQMKTYRSPRWIHVLDPVTYVQLRTIKHGLVKHAYRNTFRTTLSRTLHRDREHVDWIRGYHERDSPEAAALLTAHGLARG